MSGVTDGGRAGGPTGDWPLTRSEAACPVQTTGERSPDQEEQEPGQSRLLPHEQRGEYDFFLPFVEERGMP